MADVKISALPASTTPLAGTEVLPIVQSGATVQVSVANLTAGRAVSAASLGVTGTSTLSGNAIISVTDNTNAALRITQLGTGNALLVEDSANPDATPFVINNVGQLFQGYTSNIDYQALGLTYSVGAQQIAGANGNSSSQLIAQFNTGSTVAIPTLVFAKSKNATVGLHTTVGSGDSLGAVIFDGSDGTNFIEAARISAAVDGTPGTNDMPGRLVFSTTADGASSPTERMRIDSSGNVGIGATPSAGQGVIVNKVVTGNADSVQVTSRGAFQSDVTSSGIYYRTVGSTQATAFTLGEMTHFSAQQGTLGATSTVTNQIGFNAATSLIGATNNYGFYSNIASTANRYNFYAAGTADNFFTGKVSTNSFVTAFAATATPAGGTANTGYNMGSAGVGIIWGSGAPTATMPAGSIYLRTDGGASSRIYSTSGGGTWLAITSL